MTAARDLLDEFAGYAGAATEAHDARLAALGVPSDWLHDPMGPARYGATWAALGRDGLWDVQYSGAPVLVLPEPPLSAVTDPLWPTTELCDLIAMRTSEPGRWWRRRGDAVLLGAEAVDEAMYRDQPLVLHPDPLAWMQAGGVGAVILDWGACLPLHLGGAPSITCATLALAERLDRALRARPAAVRIDVATPAARAA